MYLTIEFPKIIIENQEYNVVFFEKNAEESCKLGKKFYINYCNQTELIIFFFN